MNDRTSPSHFAARLLGEAGSIRTPRIFEAICEQVRTQLSRGRLKPGDKLPAERELAVQFGSSRTAVREALRSLEIAGVIELRKGVKGGAFIREGDPAVVTRSFGDMVNLGRISLENLTESRVIMQDAVIRLASERGSDADFDALEESIALTERLTREKRWDERRVQLVGFYRLLAQATRNDVMVIMVDALTDIVLQVIARDSAVPKEDTVKVQRAIVECLRRRDAEAAAALMSRHLKALHGHLFNAASQRSRAGRAGRGSAPAGRAASSAAAKRATSPTASATRAPGTSPALKGAKAGARATADAGTGATRPDTASRKTAGGAAGTAGRTSAAGGPRSAPRKATAGAARKATAGTAAAPRKAASDGSGAAARKAARGTPGDTGTATKAPAKGSGRTATKKNGTRTAGTTATSRAQPARGTARRG